MEKLSSTASVELFFARLSDANAKPTAKSERAMALRIVERLGNNRAAIHLAAMRASEIGVRALLASLEQLDAIEPPKKDVRSRLARGSEHRQRGELRRAASELERVIREAKKDPYARAEAHRLLGSVYRAQGRADAALKHKRTAMKLFRELGDVGRTAVSKGEVGTVLAGLGRLREARACHEEALAVHRRLHATREEGVELSYLGVTLHRLGRFAEAERAHVAALALHKRTRNRRLEGADELHLGYVLHELGRFDAARAHFERAIAIFREIGDGALLGVTLSYAAALFVEMGAAERAGPMLREAFAHHERAGSVRHEAISLIHTALHHEALGESAAAKKALVGALRVGASALEPEQRAWALALLGRFDEARAIPIEDPMTARAIEILAGRPASSKGETSSRIRHASRVAERDHAIVVARDGRAFTTAKGRVSLARRKALSRALVLLTERRLAKPGDGVSWQEVLEAAWPGERVQPEAGFLRVRNALFLLRKLGIGAALLTREGYLLDPSVGVAFGEI